VHITFILQVLHKWSQQSGEYQKGVCEVKQEGRTGLIMELSGLDIGILAIFFVCVISVGLFKSRKEKTSEDYFLAGRGLKWWLIGFSLIAANISAEQFVGMSGQAAKGSIGLARVTCPLFLIQCL
jgi:hypothetical protein